MDLHIWLLGGTADSNLDPVLVQWTLPTEPFSSRWLLLVCVYVCVWGGDSVA